MRLFDCAICPVFLSADFARNRRERDVIQRGWTGYISDVDVIISVPPKFEHRSPIRCVRDNNPMLKTTPNR